jgi:hypothetical protein
MNEKPASTIRIDLTADQKQIVKAATNRDVESLEFDVREVEQRIAPKIILNHNETFIVEDQP